eukprot:gene26275-biopygen15475
MSRDHLRDMNPSETGHCYGGSMKYGRMGGEECIEIWFGGEAPKPYLDTLLPAGNINIHDLLGYAGKCRCE